jgi:hypothetical protein
MSINNRNLSMQLCTYLKNDRKQFSLYYYNISRNRYYYWYYYSRLWTYLRSTQKFVVSDSEPAARLVARPLEIVMRDEPWENGPSGGNHYGEMNARLKGQHSFLIVFYFRKN